MACSFSSPPRQSPSQDNALERDDPPSDPRRADRHRDAAPRDREAAEGVQSSRAASDCPSIAATPSSSAAAPPDCAPRSRLKRRDVDVIVATQSAFGGTSACSGSDKQTLHTANGAGRGDDFRAMADALGAGGAMDEDTAYVEAVGSPRALSSLQFMGLPIPQDRLGGVLRYQTDHDEVGRATSCGPRTSRLMVQALAREAIRLECADLQSYDRRPPPGRTRRTAPLRRGARDVAQAPRRTQSVGARRLSLAGRS